MKFQHRLYLRYFLPFEDSARNEMTVKRGWRLAPRTHNLDALG